MFTSCGSTGVVWPSCTFFGLRETWTPLSGKGVAPWRSTMRSHAWWRPPTSAWCTSNPTWVAASKTSCNCLQLENINTWCHRARLLYGGAKARLFFDNRSSRPGDDLKDDVCPSTAVEAWQCWNAQKHKFTLLQQPGPVVVCPECSTLCFSRLAERKSCFPCSLEVGEAKRLVPEEPREENRMQKHQGSYGG